MPEARLAAKLEQAIPAAPLFLLKATSAIPPPGGIIRRPLGYAGKTLYEGELGIVIGRSCHQADDAAARAAIFGYTGVNDVTALDLLYADQPLPHWAWANSCDTFGPVGPVVVSGHDLAAGDHGQPDVARDDAAAR
jgi:2-keto-4-pentenoate hydratase/2-oxohepta-3-ene-1,7-dioic acid hydratase in catechol pathway